VHEIGWYQLTFPQCAVVQFVSRGPAKVLATCCHDGNIELDHIIAAISVEGRSSTTIKPPSSVATIRAAEADAYSSVTNASLGTIEKSVLAASASTRCSQNRSQYRTIRSAPSPVLVTYLRKPSLDPSNTTQNSTSLKPEIETPTHGHSQEAVIALCVIAALLGIIEFLMFVVTVLVRLAIQ
jgi:hypothetical protein